MRLAVDANIFVSELLRKRGRELIARESFELFVAAEAWDEAQHEISKRISAMVQQKRLSPTQGQALLEDVISVAQSVVPIVPIEIYHLLKEEALLRIPRDPNEWPTVALALSIDADIWTMDKDFLGCGIATWTTETLLLQKFDLK